MDFNEHNRYLIFLVVETLFIRVLLSVPYQWRHQDVENGFELQVLSYFSMTIHELSLLLQLLDVDVAGPNERREDTYKGVESGDVCVQVL